MMNEPLPFEMPIFSVGDFAKVLQNVITDRFGDVRIRGEISGLKVHSSGHVYFSLKDQEAVLDGICWKGNAGRLRAMLVDGLEVICRGRVTTYPLRSKYQIIVEHMEAAGIGALLKVLEERKKRLEALGLFDAARKRPLPFLPRRIGIITSPTGAVIRDILHRLEDRMPCHVLLWPVSVQGDRAPQEIVEAIRGFHLLGPDLRPDVLIIARGGGSVEDLWCFNDEEVVRAVAACEFPVISAIGHETDFTLIDYVADRRAPTPTAAAEMAVPVRGDLIATLMHHGQRLVGSVTRRCKEAQLATHSVSRALATPQLAVERHMQTLDDRAARLEGALDNGLRRATWTLGQMTGRLTPQALKRLCVDRGQTYHQLGERLLNSFSRRQKEWASRLTQSQALLQTLSYENILRRGFVLVSHEGALVVNAADLHAGDRITLTYHDGRGSALVEPS